MSKNLINELKFADILKKSADKRAPIAKQFQINARFMSIDPETLIITFNTQDFGPQGSRRIHTTEFQVNERLDKVKFRKGLELYRIQNNLPALRSYLINGYFLNGNTNYYCSCESFLFGGFKFISTKLKSNIDGQEESRRPVKTNPMLYGISCKHIAGTIQNINIFKESILRALQQNLKLLHPVSTMPLDVPLPGAQARQQARRNKKHHRHEDIPWTTLDVNLDTWDEKQWREQLMKWNENDE